MTDWLDVGAGVAIAGVLAVTALAAGWVASVVAGYELSFAVGVFGWPAALLAGALGVMVYA